MATGAVSEQNLTEPDEEQRADERGQDDQQRDPDALPHPSGVCVSAGSPSGARSSSNTHFYLPGG